MQPVSVKQAYNIEQVSSMYVSNAMVKVSQSTRMVYTASRGGGHERRRGNSGADFMKELLYVIQSGA